jgi:lipid II:glycine glycyltransferase (peptidoglycan interpeptide bridge formation enzyme)
MSDVLEQSAMDVLPRIEISPILSAIDCLPECCDQGFLQSKFWGLFKSRTGWQAYSCTYSFYNKDLSGRILVLKRKFAKLFSFLYVPFGAAELSSIPERWITLAALGRALGEAFGGRDVFIRFDLPWECDVDPAKTKEEKKPDIENSLGFHISGLYKGTDVQVPDTVILDLRDEEQRILAKMKPKWRYNIRLSQKKGISVTDEGFSSLPLFMSLYKETARRDRIAIHPESYYKTLFETSSEISEVAQENSITTTRPRLSLYVARHKDEVLACIIVLHFGNTSTYLYGASSSEKRNLMPTYALQWQAILDAKRFGADKYDFFGIPPDDKDASHPMAGLYLFKTGFGGEIIHRYGAYDISLRPFLYFAFRTAEKMRSFWHKRIKKSLNKKTVGLSGKATKESTIRNVHQGQVSEELASLSSDSENTKPSNP